MRDGREIVKDITKALEQMIEAAREAEVPVWEQLARQKEKLQLIVVYSRDGDLWSCTGFGLSPHIIAAVGNSACRAMANAVARGSVFAGIVAGAGSHHLIEVSGFTRLTVNFYWDREGAWFVHIEEFRGCMSQGDTVSEALAMILDDAAQMLPCCSPTRLPVC